METLPLYRLEQCLEELKALLPGLRTYLDCCLNIGDIVGMEIYRGLIMQLLNDIGEMEARITIMKLKGETDTITTDYALDYIGCDYTKTNGSFYINS